MYPIIPDEMLKATEAYSHASYGYCVEETGVAGITKLTFPGESTLRQLGPGQSYTFTLYTYPDDLYAQLVAILSSQGSADRQRR